jgi:hypothetical protein
MGGKKGKRWIKRKKENKVRKEGRQRQRTLMKCYFTIR